MIYPLFYFVEGIVHRKIKVIVYYLSFHSKHFYDSFFSVEHTRRVFEFFCPYNASQWVPVVFGYQCSLKYVVLQRKESQMGLKWHEGE